MDKSNFKNFLFCGVLFFLTLISSFCVFFGLQTGLPSDERLLHELGGVENVIKKEKELKTFMTTGKHVRSEFIAKDKKKEMAKLSPYFDMLRTYHADEQYIIKILADMAKKKDFQPNSFIYGPFFFYQMGSGIFVAKLMGLTPTQKDAVYFIKNPSEFISIYLGARTVVAIMAVLSVIIVFLIGLKLGGMNLGIIAALMTCSIPLFNLVGKFIKPDMPCLFWSAGVLLFSIYAYKHKRLRDYILAGVFVAFAAGSKYPGVLSCFYLVAYFLAGHYDSSKKIKDNLKNIIKVKEFKYLIIAGLVCIATFIITNPSCILRYETFSHDFSWIAGVLRKGFFLTNLFNFLVCFIFDGFFYTVGPLMMIVMLAGMGFVLSRPSKLYWPMLPVIVLFVIMASRGVAGSEAYMMPLFVPFCLISAHLLEQIKNKKLMWVVTTVVVIPSFSMSIAYDSIAAGENTRLTATKWINKNIPAGSSISRSQYPVSYRTAMTNPEKYPQYSMDLQPEKAKNADYYIDSSYQWEWTLWHKRFAKNYWPSVKPSDEFIEIKRIEKVPMLLGFIPIQNNYMLASYIEVVNPKIIIYKRKKEN